MSKKTAVLGFLCVICQLHAATLLIDTVMPPLSTELSESELQSIRFMENGLMDSAFELGHILFNTSSNSSRLLEDIPVNPSEYRSLGAEYLIRIQADFQEKKMLYQLYSVRDNLMIISGEWLLEEFENSVNTGISDLFNQAGVQTMERISEHL